MTSLVVQSKVLFSDFTPEKITLLKNTVCKDASDNELQLFLHACKRTGLDPFMKQIYAVKRKNQMTIQTGIDGYRLIAERTGSYAPGKEPVYAYDGKGKLRSATSFVKKQTQDGTWHEVSATAFWEEYVQVFYDKNTGQYKASEFWNKMGHTMLSKCAEALALRKAFPGDFSGIYTAEEMAQADNEVAPSSIQIEEEDISIDEVNEYIKQNFEPEALNFRNFFEEMKETQKWTYRKCLEMFKKHEEHTKNTFMNWLNKKD